jgi:hypothetical protein
VLVFDNLEAISNEEPLMIELSNLILLLDDANYANHKV